MVRPCVPFVLLVACAQVASGDEVIGRIAMPEACSPSVSPAVVQLVPRVKPPPERQRAATSVVLVNQRMLQFVPRVQAIAVGQTVRFTNGDSEAHNVHILGAGRTFNQTITPGQTVEITPQAPGLLKIACDIHIFMRGYVVVAATPWVSVCDRDGRFRFRDVPPGAYDLDVWHELGAPLRREVRVVDGAPLDLGEVAVRGPDVSVGVALTERPRRWAEVIDRVAVSLAASQDAARRPNGRDRAVTLVDDAYFAEFEASDMEAAVRGSLGFGRASDLEGLFRKLRGEIARMAAGQLAPLRCGESTRDLLAKLQRAAEDLNAKGIVDRSHVGSMTAPADSLSSSGAAGDAWAQLDALSRAFEQVRLLADRGDSRAASNALIAAYFSDFEPIETHLATRDPALVARLEGRFAALRGRLNSGHAGTDLAADLDGLRRAITTALYRNQTAQADGFGLSFGASLLTILREGVEVILILTMLVALIAKVGAPRVKSALRWGVCLGVIASLLTALGLNLLVIATRGRAREILEGGVMLVASAVLFYVSYWLISQVESQRWLQFLKRSAQHNAALGGCGAVGLTAFLAVYREGAETALLYQALLGSQTGANGRVGVVLGLIVGLVLLAIIYALLRATSVRLPLRAFFQVTGAVLFAMAVVFAGSGVFELQMSGVMKITPIGWSWLGQGIPALGVHPTAQSLAIQGLMLAGAMMAFLVLCWPARVPPPEHAASRNGSHSPRDSRSTSALGGAER